MWEQEVCKAWISISCRSFKFEILAKSFKVCYSTCPRSLPASSLALLLIKSHTTSLIIINCPWFPLENSHDPRVIWKRGIVGSDTFTSFEQSYRHKSHTSTYAARSWKHLQRRFLAISLLLLCGHRAASCWRGIHDLVTLLGNHS